MRDYGKGTGTTPTTTRDAFERTLLDALSHAVLAIDHRGRIRFSNHAAGCLFGAAAESLVGKDLVPLIEVDHRPQVQRALTRALAGHPGRPLECSIGLHTASNWFEVELTPHGDGCLFVARDLRTRRPLRADVSRQHQGLQDTLAGLLDNIPIGILIADHHGSPRLVNRAARDLLGMHALARIDAWSGAGFLLRADGEEASLEDIPVLKTLRDGRPRRDVELQILRPWGDAVPVLLNTDAVRSPGGRIVEVCCTFTNIRERAHMERQLHHAQKMEAIGVLAGGIAHDFNNILCAITGYAEIGLMRASPNEPLQRLLGEIKKAGDRAAHLTRQLLSFSRTDTLAPQVLHLNATLRDMEAMLRRLIDENVELSTDLAEKLPPVKADPGHLEQIVLNLVVNAADAMPEGGRVRLRSECVEVGEAEEGQPARMPPGRYVVLTVSDSGIGMDAATLGHIFEPFFTTKGRSKGTGLGLSTVYGIVKRNRGMIEVESEPGRGTSFRVFLPCVDETADPPAPRSVRAGPGGAGGETVLLVEDEPMVRALIREILDGAGYQVLEACNGKEALDVAAATSEPIQLLVTDVVMPEMGGLDLARSLQDRRRDLRVLFVSGYADEALTRSGVMGRATSFLPKPFDANTLMERVREVLDHAPT